ncbi:MAG TPA: MotA/TolQ/ExbB proton channel family protein [Myxococcota bacterium]|nr:MotA/TolQ/ExbB proton channel family protein [Myxococcota bacterium]
MDPATAQTAADAAAPATTTAPDATAAAAGELGTTTTGTTAATTALESDNLFRMLNQGGLTVYPLALGSVLAVAIVLERLWRFRGLERATRDLTRRVVDHLSKRDFSGARALCEAAKTPVGSIFLEGLRWQDIALEDLERVLATSRQEANNDLKRGLWVIGTIGSLAPFIGLFGTVVGIIRSFHDMAVHGSGGFAIVAAGISEALVATGAGLLVAIVSLAFYNYLQVRVGSISGVFARACERFVQALLYVESGAQGGSGTPRAERGGSSEVRHGHPLPA